MLRSRERARSGRMEVPAFPRRAAGANPGRRSAGGPEGARRRRGAQSVPTDSSLSYAGTIRFRFEGVFSAWRQAPLANKLEGYLRFSRGRSQPFSRSRAATSWPLGDGRRERERERERRAGGGGSGGREVNPLQPPQDRIVIGQPASGKGAGGGGPCRNWKLSTYAASLTFTKAFPSRSAATWQRIETPLKRYMMIFTASARSTLASSFTSPRTKVVGQGPVSPVSPS